MKGTERASWKTVFKLVKRAIIITMAVFIIASCSDEVERLYSEGKELSKSEDPAELKRAAKKLQRVAELKVEAQSNLAGIYKRLGERYIQIESWDSAIEYLKKGLEIQPNNKFMHYNLGLCYAQKARGSLSAAEKDRYIDLAVEEYRTAIQIDTKYTDAHYALAMVYFFELHLWKEAVYHLKQVLEVEPSNVETLFALGRFNYEMGNLKEALDQYQKLLFILPRKSPRMGVCRENIARIHRELNR